MMQTGAGVLKKLVSGPSLAQPRQPMTLQGIYIVKNGKATGPFTDEQLEQMRRSGSVSGDDLAWREGMPEWRPLSTIVDAVQPPPIPLGHVASGSVEPPKIPNSPSGTDSEGARTQTRDRRRVTI